MRTASILGLAVTSLVILLWPGQARAQVLEPWDANLPIVNVQKEVFRPVPLDEYGNPYDVCQYGWAFDVGPNGQSREVYFQEGTDDVHTTPQARYWNGSAWVNPGAPTDGYTDGDADGYFDAPHDVNVEDPFLDPNDPGRYDIMSFLAGQRLFYDSESGAVIRFSECFDSHSSTCMTFYDLSLPGFWGYGRHFQTPKVITPGVRGPGGRFDYQQDQTMCYRPDQPALADYGYYDIFDSDLGNTHYSKSGMNTIRLSNPESPAEGKIVHVITWSPGKATNGDTVQCGAQCLIGSWNANLHDYDWTWSNAIVASEATSFLTEGAVAELSDGRLLVDFRDYRVVGSPSNHRYYSVGTIAQDGTITLDDPLQLCYDDDTLVGSGGSPPDDHSSNGSYAQFIRSSQTGKLYFIGNLEEDISLKRTVLGIAEVDESGIGNEDWVPRLKKDSVTLIDMKQPDQQNRFALSNFVVRENQATGNMEVYVSPLGGAGQFRAPALKYTLQVVTNDTVRAIYRETFRYSQSQVALNTAGWYGNVGSTANPRGSSPTEDIAIVGGYGGSVSVATNSNCESGLRPTAPGGCLTDDVVQAAPWIPTERHIIWTDEYKVDSSWVVSEVRWEQSGDGTAPQFAMQIGTLWYLTDQIGALRTDGATFDEYSIDLAAATWRTLSFVPNIMLGQGGDSVSLLAGCGDIQAFGLFIPDHMGDYTLDFDNISLWAAQLYEGDLNGDGVVGAADLDILSAHWSQTVTPGDRLSGDCSGDGLVGAVDLDMVQSQWGMGMPPGPVPEPSVFTGLCGAALMGLYALARRRRRT